VDFDADDKRLLRQVVAYYHERLKQTPEALTYLAKRGLEHPDMVAHFHLGFADRSLGLRLPAANRQAGLEIRSRLQRLGLLRDSGHEHFNGSVVFPILDAESGEVLGLYGRKVTAHLRAGTPLHLYLPGPHKGVWNAGALKASKAVILCEAIVDALTFWCAGFRNVTAAYGVEGFTENHLAAFKAAGVTQVFIAYDRDDAGDSAAEKLAPKLMAEGLDCYRVQFPRGMDANDYALKVCPAAKSLGLALRQAVWMGKGVKSTPIMDTEAQASQARGRGALFPLAAKETHSATVALEVEISTPVATTASNVSKASATDTSAATGAPTTLENVSTPTPATTEAPYLPTTSPASTPEPKVTEEEVVFELGGRRYRVRGLAKNTAPETLRINLLATLDADAGRFHVDTLDLYSAKARAAYLKQAAGELGVSEDALKHDVGQVLLKLEQLQEETIRKALEPKKKAVTPTDTERDAALELLKAPNLLERILADFEKCGVVGEETNKLVGYLAAVSRKLEAPLAVIIQSSSAAGKSSLMEAVLALVPEEDKVKYSAMTGQSLFYMGETDLKNKVLAIVEEEGASHASYALKLLQSEGELTIASTGKDTATGKLVTTEYHVEGPVQLFLTTTAIELDEELLNRCLVLTVDEDREQTSAIHRLQRESQTLEGLLARRKKDALLKLHQNAQRLLRPLLVANPFARELTFLDDRTRTRRDHVKYLTLIRTITLLHQHQRPVKTVTHEGQEVQYIEVTREDVAVANRLAHQVLGRSLDELPPQTRRLLGLLDDMVSKACAAQAMERKAFRFTRKDVRAFTGWGDTQLKVHLQRLDELEYLAVRQGGRNQAAVYELLYDGQGKEGTPFLAGLLDVAKLGPLPGSPPGTQQHYDSQWSASEALWAGGGRPVVGPLSGGGRGVAAEASSSETASSEEENRREPPLDGRLRNASYVQSEVPAAGVA
jgi:DNA primase